MYRVYLAVGSNLGDRFGNIQRALQMLCEENVTKLRRTSFLHETAPMYVTDQPSFLNGAVLLETRLEPSQLLKKLKQIEGQLGRDLHGLRNGPRPVDLDILLYEKRIKSANESRWEPLLVNSTDLVVPHPRIEERDFVVQPLLELAGKDAVHPTLNKTLEELWAKLEASSSAVRVLPLPRSRLLHWNRTIVMGILNVTPDSFSDGGKWTQSLDETVQRALDMEREGADIIDIGGESTRPGAKEIAIEEEIKRTVPVIERIRQESHVPISIDTRNSAVARAAVEAGADIVNDISGGTFDEDMFRTVADLGVPIIIMHMRGTPETMQAMTLYDDVVEEVSMALFERSRAAEDNNIPRWLQMADPGIGFAKNLHGNLQLLKSLSVVRKTLDNVPLLVGTSRKGFIGTLTHISSPEDRDPGTISSCVAALCLESPTRTCTILRVHNVRDTKQAITVLDAIRDA